MQKNYFLKWKIFFIKWYGIFIRLEVYCEVKYNTGFGKLFSFEVVNIERDQKNVLCGVS